MTTTGVPSAKSGADYAIAYANMNARATKNVSEMSLVELLEGLIEACDREIASKDETKNA